MRRLGELVLRHGRRDEASRRFLRPTAAGDTLVKVNLFELLNSVLGRDGINRIVRQGVPPPERETDEPPSPLSPSLPVRPRSTK